MSIRVGSIPRCGFDRQIDSHLKMLPTRDDYFKNWLDVLGVSEQHYVELIERIDQGTFVF